MTFQDFLCKAGGRLAFGYRPRQVLEIYGMVRCGAEILIAEDIAFVVSFLVLLGQCMPGQGLGSCKKRVGRTTIPWQRTE